LSSLLIDLIKSMSVIAVCAYIFSQTKTFRSILNRRMHKYDKFILIAFFTGVSILGTYMNIEVNGALANTRPIGAAVAGLFGGPLTGATVGLIAGFHRYLLGGFTNFACAIATIFEGLVGGIMYRYNKGKEPDTKIALITGLIAETLQMLIIVATARPIDAAINTVKILAIPMIVANSIGIAIFINILKNAKDEFNRVGALQAQKALNIANMTLPFLRKGFDNVSSKKAAQIILEKSDVDAVCITDDKEILAYAGTGNDHHTAGQPLKDYEIDAINRGEIRIINTKEEIGCSTKECQIHSAILAPLKFKGDNAGGLIIFYYSRNKKIDEFDVNFVLGIAKLLTTQLELARLEKQAQMATAAELKVLQAQIHPHFLFNALNTIASFCRTDPGKARELILNLSTFFRKTLNRGDSFVTIEEEIDLVNSYLSIEKARFGDRLDIIYNISGDLLKRKIPAFIIQPLVENSIKHGISPHLDGGRIEINIEEDDNYLKISVSDTGVGMSKERYQDVITNWPGIGLKNINERLRNFYGNSYGLNIESEENIRTCIGFIIPK